MRAKQVPVSFPDDILAELQKRANNLRMPVAAYVRLRVIEMLINEQRGEASTPQAVIAPPIANDDGPHLEW